MTENLTLTEQELNNLVGGIVNGSAILANYTKAGRTPFTADFVEGDLILPGFSGTADIHTDHSVPKVTGSGLSSLTASVKSFYEVEAIDHNFRLKANLDGALLQRMGANIGKKFDDQVINGAKTIANFDNWSDANVYNKTIAGDVPTAEEITQAFTDASRQYLRPNFTPSALVTSDLSFITSASTAGGALPYANTLPLGVIGTQTDADTGAFTVYLYDLDNEPVVTGLTETNVFDKTNDLTASLANADFLKLEYGLGHKSVSKIDATAPVVKIVFAKGSTK